MDEVGRKKLRTWLQKSLANHSEGDNGLVDYVEAIVGDAEGEDDDLREKWTEKLDDFLAESSADFTNVLLDGVRSGNFGKIWRGGGGQKDEKDESFIPGEARAKDAGGEAASGVPGADGSTSGRFETPDDQEHEHDDSEDDDDDGNDEEDEDEDDEDEDGGRSRRNRRRQWEEPPPPETTPAADNGWGGGEGGDTKGQRQEQRQRQGQGQAASNNKRARFEGAAGGRGGRGDGSNAAKNAGIGSSKGGRGGQQGRGPQQMSGPSGVGRGSLAMSGMGPRLGGLGPGAPGGPRPGGPGHGGQPGQWGPNMMAIMTGRGAGGVHQGGFGPHAPIGPNGMVPFISGHVGGPGITERGLGMPVSCPGVPGGGGGMPGNGRGMPGNGRGMPGNGRGIPRGMPEMTARGPRMPGAAGMPEMTARGPRMPGAAGMPTDSRIHGMGPDMNSRGALVDSRGPGLPEGVPTMRGDVPVMRGGPPGMQGGGPGIPVGGPGMPRDGPGVPRDGPGMHRDGPGMHRDGSAMPRDRLGIPQGRPGMLQNGPGIPRDGSGMPQGGIGMPGGRGSGMPGKPMQDGAGVKGPRGSGGGLLPTPQTPPEFAGPSRGIRGPPLLPGPPPRPPPPNVDGITVQRGRGVGPLDPRGPAGPLDGRKTGEMSIGIGGGPGAGRGGRPQGGVRGEEGNRPPERRSPSRGPEPRPQAFVPTGPPGGLRGPGVGGGPGTGLPRPGPPDHRMGGMKNEERGGMRAPGGVFEGADSERQGRGRGVDRLSEQRVNSMPRRPDIHEPMEMSRGPGMRQGGQGVMEVSGGGDKTQDVRRSVFERLGDRPRDDAMGQQGRDVRQQQHQHQRPAGPESFRQGSNITRGNAPENVRRSPSNNPPIGGQGGQRVESSPRSGPDLRNAQTGGGGGQGPWSGPPTQTPMVHDSGRVGHAVGPDFHREGGGGKVPGPETRRYPTEDNGRGGPVSEPRRQYSPTGPGARRLPPGDQMHTPTGLQGNTRENAQRQGGPGNAQGQARPPQIEHQGDRHVSPRRGDFEGGNSRPSSGVGRDQYLRGEHRSVTRPGFGEGGGSGGRPPQPTQEGYPPDQQQVQRGVPFQGSFSDRNGQAVGGDVLRAEGGSRAWGHAATPQGGTGGGNRPLPATATATDHSHGQPQQQQEQQQRGSYFQQVSDSSIRGEDRRQHGQHGGGSVSWGSSQGQQQQLRWAHRDGHEPQDFEADRDPSKSDSGSRLSQAPDRSSAQQGGGSGQAQSRRPDQGRPRGWSGQGQGREVEKEGWTPPHMVRSPSSAAQATVRVTKIPADVGQGELFRHFEAFGEILEMRLRAVRQEECGKGQKEALVQFGSSREAQACVSSPKAVANNRFIVVQLSDVNLIDVHTQYSYRESSLAGEAVAREKAAAEARAEAAAAIAARKKAQEKLLAQASKTKEVVAQQRLLILLRERVKVATQQLEANRTKRDKVQDLLRMMEERQKPESEQTRYRRMLSNLSAKVATLEAAAATAELQAQVKKLEKLEAEARAIGATVPPPPNADVLARLMFMDGGREGGDRGEAMRGRGFGRGRGHGATSITSAPPGRGHGGSSSFPSSAINSAAAEPRARSLDNRPTTVKVSGLPEGAGEGDLRVHANMAGVVVGAAMLDRPGEGVVKFAERWAAENFMAKSKSFGGIPLTMSWYTAPFPSPSLQFRPHDEKPRQQTRQHSVASTATVNAEPLQQPPTVVNSGTGDRIELKLAPVQDEEYHRGARTGNTGGRGWGDRLGEAERVAWEGSEFERGSAGGGGRRDGDQATGEKDGGNGSSSGSPMRFPRVEDDEDEDEVYKDMGF